MAKNRIEMVNISARNYEASSPGEVIVNFVHKRSVDFEFVAPTFASQSRLQDVLNRWTQHGCAEAELDLYSGLLDVTYTIY